MIRLFFLSALFLALNGCVSTAKLSTPVTDESHERWASRQQQLASVQNWHIRGRVALFVDDDVYNLGLNWKLNKNDSTLKLEAALGQGMIQIEKNSDQVTLLTSEDKSYSGQNAAQVLYQATGWSIPVEGLESWIKGINHNNSDYLPDIDSQGRALSLQQDGWKINYLQHKEFQVTELSSYELPRKIYMKRQNIALKIVIDQWQAQQNTVKSDIFPAFKD